MLAAGFGSALVSAFVGVVVAVTVVVVGVEVGAEVEVEVGFMFVLATAFGAADEDVPGVCMDFGKNGGEVTDKLDVTGERFVEGEYKEYNFWSVCPAPTPTPTPLPGLMPCLLMLL